MCAPGSCGPRSDSRRSSISGNARRVAFGQTVDDAAVRTAWKQRRPAAGSTCCMPRRQRWRAGRLLALGSAAFLLRRPEPARLGRRTSYARSRRSCAYAGVILALRQVIATPVDYVRESIASPTTLVQFFSMLDEASPVARFLGVIDLLRRLVDRRAGHRHVGALPRGRRDASRSSSPAPTSLSRCLAALAMAVSGGTA